MRCCISRQVWTGDDMDEADMVHSNEGTLFLCFPPRFCKESRHSSSVLRRDWSFLSPKTLIKLQFLLRGSMPPFRIGIRAWIMSWLGSAQDWRGRLLQPFWISDTDDSSLGFPLCLFGNMRCSLQCSLLFQLHFMFILAAGHDELSGRLLSLSKEEGQCGCMDSTVCASLCRVH